MKKLYLMTLLSLAFATANINSMLSTQQRRILRNQRELERRKKLIKQEKEINKKIKYINILVKESQEEELPTDLSNITDEDIETTIKNLNQTLQSFNEEQEEYDFTFENLEHPNPHEIIETVTCINLENKSDLYEIIKKIEDLSFEEDYIFDTETLLTAKKQLIKQKKSIREKLASKKEKNLAKNDFLERADYLLSLE